MDHFSDFQLYAVFVLKKDTDKKKDQPKRPKRNVTLHICTLCVSCPRGIKSNRKVNNMDDQSNRYSLKPYEELALAFSDLNRGLTQMRSNLGQVSEYHKQEQALTKVFGSM